MADKIQLYEDQPIRTAWVEDEEEWYFSIVDVVGVLIEQTDYQKARKYWNKRGFWHKGGYYTSPLMYFYN